MEYAEIGIIGGSGFYDLEGLEEAHSVRLRTPFGERAFSILLFQDLSIVPLIKELSHLPIMVDPSHGTGKRSLVPSMAKAALVAGAHGLLVEVHPEPEKALSDGPQSLTFQGFEALMRDAKRLNAFLGF